MGSRVALGAMVRVNPTRALRKIADALARTGRPRLAAAVLGVSERTLERYVARLGGTRVWAAALEQSRARAA
jgi:hypothetical protein